MTQTDAGIEISVPTADRKPTDTIIALELDKPASEIAPVQGASDGTQQPAKKAKKK